MNFVNPTARDLLMSLFLFKPGFHRTRFNRKLGSVVLTYTYNCLLSMIHIFTSSYGLELLLHQLSATLILVKSASTSLVRFSKSSVGVQS